MFMECVKAKSHHAQQARLNSQGMSVCLPAFPSILSKHFIPPYYQNLQFYEQLYHQNPLFITSNFSIAHEMRRSISSSYLQVVQVYLSLCQRSSLLKGTPQPKIAKKH